MTKLVRRGYTSRGIAVARAALKAKGVLAIWSAKDDQKFKQRLGDGGFDVKVQHERGHLNAGARHTIFLGCKS